MSGWLTFAAAFLPAFGAALAAIRTQAEAQRLSRRSHGMKQSLEKLDLEFASISPREGEGNSQRLRARADRITDLMVREMLDWRVVLLDQPFGNAHLTSLHHLRKPPPRLGDLFVDHLAFRGVGELRD